MLRKRRRIEENNGEIFLVGYEKEQDMITYEEETEEIKNFLLMEHVEFKWWE